MHQGSTTHMVHNCEKKKKEKNITYDPDIYARGRVKKKKKLVGVGTEQCIFAFI